LVAWLFRNLLQGGLNYEALKSMKYLMMCINETMRLYPALVRYDFYLEVEFAETACTLLTAKILLDI